MEKGKVDIGLIRRYLRGELNPREMYALERRAQDDPVLMDIILGMERETQDVHEANLGDIRKRIALRAGRNRIRRIAPARRWAVAASVLLAFIVGALWLTRQDGREQQPAAASAPPVADEQHSERLALQTSDDTTDGTAAAGQQSQPTAPAREKATVQTPKRLAVAPVEEVEIADIRPPSETLAASVLRKEALDTTAEAQVTAYTPLAKRSVVTAPASQMHALKANTLAAQREQPEPENGWQAYNQYLKQGTKHQEGVKGTVTLMFTVDDEGTPADIRVIQTDNPTLNERAMRLVREGAKWKPGENGERNTVLQVRF